MPDVRLVRQPLLERSRRLPGAAERSVHVLAFGFDPEDAGLQDFFRAYREDRIRRAKEITERFRSLGVPLEYESVRRETGRGVPTRAHVARALVREGLVPDERTVFGKYLSRGKPAFVEKAPTPPSEVFGRVHDAGGVAVLAHPGWTHGPEEIRRWAEEGLDGVEVLHPRNHEKVRRRLDELADELGLLRSGGSDWHGPDAEGRPAIGSQRVPADWMDRILERSRPAEASAESESG